MHANLRDYLRVKEAAQFLGVSPSTLRNWERAGKIAAYRNPMNSYRLFRKSDLEQILSDVRSSPTTDHDPTSKTTGRDDRDDERTKRRDA